MQGADRAPFQPAKDLTALPCLLCWVSVQQDVADALPLAGLFLLTLILHEVGHRCGWWWFGGMVCALLRGYTP